MKRLYARPPSFTSLLPWMEYDTERKLVWLEDGISCAAVFELTPVGCEARPQAFFERLREGLMQVLCDAIPEEDEGSPWVLQVYVQDELDLDTLWQALQGNIHPRAQGSAFTEHYLGVLADHLDALHPSRGALSRAPRGARSAPGAGACGRCSTAGARAARARCIAWRPPRSLPRSRRSAWTASRPRGSRHAARAAEDFYRWLLAWLNPRPAAAEGDSAALARLAPYPERCRRGALRGGFGRDAWYFPARARMRAPAPGGSMGWRTAW